MHIWDIHAWDEVLSSLLLSICTLKYFRPWNLFLEVKVWLIFNLFLIEHNSKRDTIFLFFYFFLGIIKLRKYVDNTFLFSFEAPPCLKQLVKYAHIVLCKRLLITNRFSRGNTFFDFPTFCSWTPPPSDTFSNKSNLVCAIEVWELWPNCT